MQPSIYGPFPFLPITRRKNFSWPDGKRLALWVIPNIEFFHLDDPMPGSKYRTDSARQCEDSTMCATGRCAITAGPRGGCGGLMKAGEPSASRGYAWR